MRSSTPTTIAAAFCIGMSVALQAELKQPAAAQPADPGTHWLVFVDDLHVNFVGTGRLRTMLRETAADLMVPGDQVSIRATVSSGIADGGTEALAIQAAIKNISGNALKPEDFLNAGSAPGGRALEELRRRAVTALAKAKRFVETAAPTPAPRRTLLFISNGYVDDGDIQDTMSELVQSAVQHGVRIVAIDAKVLSSAPGPRVDADVWNRYVATSKGALRRLAEETGGFLRGDRVAITETIAAARRLP